MDDASNTAAAGMQSEGSGPDSAAANSAGAGKTGAGKTGAGKTGATAKARRSRAAKKSAAAGRSSQDSTSGFLAAPQRPATVTSIDAQGAIIDAALALAAERGWPAVTLAAVAEAAGLPLSAVYRQMRDKGDILAALARRTDAEVLARVGQGADEPLALEESAAPTSPRDRLFDVLMARFDVLSRHRAGLAAVLRAGLAEPFAALAGLSAVIRSMGWMLEAAGIGSGGLAGPVRARMLAAVYLATFRVWAGDDSPDQSRTMASLDAQLRRLEGLGGRLFR